ncbi:TetR/AcrR family transcriptional regulator [Demetria terragena]|uniref:TetR/AcrR family transcriptional regulator n=1 Tax=Demetria terragena TaxID=63959 RepID=UPI00039F18C1|nr:TetR/AcrR family transcriptional regulator [Demetria terragena]
MNAPASTDGRSLRWEQHKTERRKAVLSAALELIESSKPGAEVNVQDIAERAGINRSVLYRHFEDRADLDLAVQQEICSQLGMALAEELDFHGTPREISDRAVTGFVHWAVANPALMRFAERDLPGDAPKPLDTSIEQIAQQIEFLMSAFVVLLGAELSEDDRDSLEPWVFGLIGNCFESVRRWTSRDTLRPDVAYFTEFTCQVVWLQIEGMATSRGIDLPDVPIEELLAALDLTEPSA